LRAELLSDVLCSKRCIKRRKGTISQCGNSVGAFIYFELEAQHGRELADAEAFRGLLHRHVSCVGKNDISSILERLCHT
jgi:hypothetical protein